MARKRDLDPAIWLNEELGTVSRDVRLLYIGMISIADDEGRFRASGKALKAAVFPYDETLKTERVEQWRDELASIDGDEPLIILYEVAGKLYGHHPKWNKYQRPSKRFPSKLPEPTGKPRQQTQEKPSCTGHVPAKSQLSTEQVRPSGTGTGSGTEAGTGTDTGTGEEISPPDPSETPREAKILNELYGISGFETPEGRTKRKGREPKLLTRADALRRLRRLSEKYPDTDILKIAFEMGGWLEDEGIWPRTFQRFENQVGRKSDWAGYEYDPSKEGQQTEAEYQAWRKEVEAF